MSYLELEIGNYVALREYGDYTDPPIIGKVNAVDKEYVTLEMFDGGYSKVWKPLVDDDGKEIVESKVHRGLVILNDIHFTNSKRLPNEVKRALHKLYLNDVKTSRHAS